MKQVDFYLISNQVSDAKLKLASRLTNKLQRLEQRTLIVTNDAPETNELDALMWSFSDTSFVTHETLRSSNEANSSGHCTAQIGDHSLVSIEVLEQDFDVLINVSDQIPVFNHHFERIAEIVEPNENAKAGARTRFKQYKNEGFELKTHNIEL